jgi:hypothetical protein
LYYIRKMLNLTRWISGELCFPYDIVYHKGSVTVLWQVAYATYLGETANRKGDLRIIP